MSKYDLHKLLSPTDFEELSRDLLQKQLDIYFETFKAGRDQGIDGRYSQGGENNKVIFQAKRYADFRSLMPDLKTELEKVKILNPERYIVTTTVELSPSDKEQIINVFKPFIKETADIYSMNDLCNLLDIHPEVKRNHPKLWMNNADELENILGHMLYKKIQNLSDFERDEMLDCMQTYVENDSLSDALSILKHSVLIISGCPGVGKTTLARRIIFQYLYLEEIKADCEQHWALHKVSETSEILDLYDKTAKQIFFFDDFLGQIELQDGKVDSFNNNFWSIVRKITNDPFKRLICTTREYILKQAGNKFTSFSESNNENKYILNIESYTKIIKCDMLYNHIFHSQIPFKYKNEIIDKKIYMQIIEHKNFNPRLIEFVLNIEYIDSKMSPEQYVKWLLMQFEHPARIWKDPFQHLTRSAQALLIALFFSNNEVNETYLKQAFERINQGLSVKYNYCKNINEFDAVLKETCDSFIKIDHLAHNKNLSISFINPSVKDYLKTYLGNIDFFEVIVKNLFWDIELQLFLKYVIDYNEKHYYCRVNDKIENCIKSAVLQLKQIYKHDYSEELQTRLFSLECARPRSPDPIHLTSLPITLTILGDPVNGHRNYCKTFLNELVELVPTNGMNTNSFDKFVEDYLFHVHLENSLDDVDKDTIKKIKDIFHARLKDFLCEESIVWVAKQKSIMNHWDDLSAEENDELIQEYISNFSPTEEVTELERYSDEVEIFEMLGEAKWLLEQYKYTWWMSTKDLDGKLEECEHLEHMKRLELNENEDGSFNVKDENKKRENTIIYSQDEIISLFNTLRLEGG